MIFRLLIILLIVGLLVYLVKSMTGSSEYKRCQKCDGKGFWRGMRGEKDKCDVCKGSGKVLRK
jgi:DnaJ-class molecular chaperone